MTNATAKLEGRGLVFENVTETSGSFGDQTDALSIPVLGCDVWGIPSRAVLQAMLILMLIVNIAAAVVVFGVPVNIRGRHVAFLFICVRTLNILDIYQCLVIFFFPFGMPPDCQSPNVIYCNISGFCFGTATILSPLVAIILALDRFFAVFFHLRYKARPQTKLKCSVLAGVIGVYGIYFTLPFYTDFGKYIAVSWLSLCSFEWGVEYRMFNLVLNLTTALLTVVLMAANLAILVKVKQQQKEFERLKASSQLMPKKKEHKQKISSNSKKNAKPLRKSKSVDNLSSSPPVIRTGSSNSTLKSLHERRGKRLPPLSIIFSPLSCSPKKEKSAPASANDASSAGCITPESRTLTDHCAPKCHLRTRIFSPPPFSPPTNDSTLLFPPSPSPNRLSPEDFRPPSPLVLSGEGFGKNSPRMVTKMTTAAKSKTLKRLSSADNMIDGNESPLSISAHRSNDPNSLRKKALGIINTTKRIASSEPFLDRPFNSRSDDESRQNSLSRDSSINSLFSSFIGNRMMSWRAGVSRPKGVRRNVSRITQMTTAICTLFAILYVPFLIRKLVQVVPSEYQEVPYAVEIVTLFGPLLSPLCNPILYVFFNPHYRENCKRLYRNIFKRGRRHHSSSDISTTQCKRTRSSKIYREKKKSSGRKKQNGATAEKKGPFAEFNRSMDDVFLSTGDKHHCDGVSISDVPQEHSAQHSDGPSSSPPSPLTYDDPKRRQSLRQLHLRRIQNLQYRRANSDDYLN